VMFIPMKDRLTTPFTESATLLTQRQMFAAAWATTGPFSASRDITAFANRDPMWAGHRPSVIPPNRTTKGGVLP
jgi:hypothetical protein